MQVSCICPWRLHCEISQRKLTAEYSRHTEQLNSVFDIDQPARISRTIGELHPLDIRRAGVIRLP
jgi:hypothetical protein